MRRVRCWKSLGYVISMIYEKYRTTYELDGVLVTLDEMPCGDFARSKAQTRRASWR